LRDAGDTPVGTPFRLVYRNASAAFLGRITVEINLSVVSGYERLVM